MFWKEHVVFRSAAVLIVGLGIVPVPWLRGSKQEADPETGGHQSTPTASSSYGPGNRALWVRLPIRAIEDWGAAMIRSGDEAPRSPIN